MSAQDWIAIIGAITALLVGVIGAIAAAVVKIQSHTQKLVANSEQKTSRVIEENTRITRLNNEGIQEACQALNGGTAMARSIGYKEGIQDLPYYGNEVKSASIAHVQGATLREIHDLKEHVKRLEGKLAATPAELDVLRDLRTELHGGSTPSGATHAPGDSDRKPDAVV